MIRASIDAGLGDPALTPESLAPRHFSRRFRAAYGMTPAEWCRRHPA
ncbi:helix-turn-helix transcriptional regulator [Dactylosporangium siamense]|nr:helix-turn-helix transcriptional regulator [Dactylosporangium siamense]